VENHRPLSDVQWKTSDEPSLSIGRVAGDGDYDLYQVTGALRLGGGVVVVANSATLELRFYDPHGTHVRSTGGSGGGPGEFQSLEWLARFTSDSIVALDVLGHRLSVFDAAGIFGRSVRLQPSADIPAPRAVGVFADGSLLATHGAYMLGGELPVRAERIQEELFRYDPEGSTARLLGSFLGRERDIIVMRRPNGRSSVERWPRILGRATAYAAAGYRFYVADNATYEIKVFRMDPPDLTMLIRKDHQHLAVTAADLRMVQDSLLESTSGPARRMTAMSFANRPSPPTTMPAYAPDIHVDADQSLWVREYSRPGDPQVMWSVFSEEGVLLASAHTPAGVRILDIGTDYVLGLWQDENDVEYVQLFRLMKGD
jgi:hypothetical protein